MKAINNNKQYTKKVPNLLLLLLLFNVKFNKLKRQQFRVKVLHAFVLMMETLFVNMKLPMIINNIFHVFTKVYYLFIHV